MLPPLTQIDVLLEDELAQIRPAATGNVRRCESSPCRAEAARRKPTIASGRVADRRRDEADQLRPRLADQPSDVVDEHAGLLRRVAPPPRPTICRSHRHADESQAVDAASAYNRGMASPSQLQVGDRSYEIYRLDELQASYDVARLPYTLRVLLENVLRNGDEADVEAVARWDAKAEPSNEISFSPSRVLLQDLTGVPAVVDLAAMRNAMADLGGDPAQINPLIPAELVIDHSVQVDAFASRMRVRAQRRARVRAEPRALRSSCAGARRSFSDFKVVPPGTGICHQVNLEYLARVVEDRDGVAFPDTLVGTDSHTTMVNGLGVLGWGVGGIEAEAAMLGQPLSMLVPQVVGFKLTRRAAARARPRPTSC